MILNDHELRRSLPDILYPNIFVQAFRTTGVSNPGPNLDPNLSSNLKL